MTKPAARTRRRSPDAVPDLFPIRTLSQLTGVNPVTLRAWERRYGVIQPQRTPKGHRLYSREDVALVERILALTARGVPVGQVRQVLNRAAQEETRGGPDEAWAEGRRAMLEAVTRFDEEALERAYEKALAVHPVDVVTRRLVVPLLVELGRRWESAEGSVAEEHFFGVYLRNKLGARFHHRVRRTGGPRLMACCWPGELHEIGVLLFALAASDAGYEVVLLGANMPLEELPAAVVRSGADGVVLAGSNRPPAEVLGRGLPALLKAVRVPVFCGGLSSVTCHDNLAAAGAVPIGEDLGAGLRVIAERLAQRR
jgi:DNA-binding transcriptional MerR regulator/methylmalonyl-CoA mutase cobalamin-binding subunit